MRGLLGLGLVLAVSAVFWERESVARAWRETRMFQNVAEKDLRPGDHIYTKRYLGLYSHHGIYVGDGRVVHFIGDSMKDARIRLCSLREFRGWQAWKIRRAMYGVASIWTWIKLAGTAYADQSSPPDVVVKRAMDLVGSPVTYDLLTRNCEGLAFFCKTGKGWHSRQALRVPAWEDLIKPHRLAWKAKHWVVKVVSTMLELLHDILVFEV